jgi:hypothetical protein
MEMLRSQTRAMDSDEDSCGFDVDSGEGQNDMLKTHS